jgi:hypothetical protein
MQMFTVPVTLLTGQVIRVSVLANDKGTATLLAVKQHNGLDPLALSAQDVLDHGEFQYLWDKDVADVLVKAITTEGPLPAFAVKQVQWAIKSAWRTEDKYRRQEEQAQQVLANLPASERAKVNA